MQSQRITRIIKNVKIWQSMFWTSFGKFKYIALKMWHLSWLNGNDHDSRLSQILICIYSPDPSEDAGEFGRPAEGFLQTSKSLRHVGGELLLFSDDHSLSRFQSLERPAPAAWVWNKWITMTHVCLCLQTCAEHLSFCWSICVSWRACAPTVWQLFKGVWAAELWHLLSEEELRSLRVGGWVDGCLWGRHGEMRCQCLTLKHMLRQATESWKNKEITCGLTLSL